MSAHRLEALMAPRSVAVLGASPRKSSHGNNVVRNLLRYGYSGRIFPVHPTATDVCGIEAQPDIVSCEQVPDCAVVCLSADKVLPAIEEASRKGVRAAVVFASGFAEAGPEGTARQDALREVAQRTGMVICGPNCLGLANIGQGISLYSAAIPNSLAIGDVAVLSHSGSGCIVLSNLGRFGVSHMVSIGNGAVVDVHDYLDYLADDPATQIAALFIETIRDPNAFAAAVVKMRAAGKHVVALKVGRSEKGAAASAAHTGSLSGASAVYDDFFASCGVISVEDIDELVETVVLMRGFAGKLIDPTHKGIAVLNVSGGEIALTCDLAQRINVNLPTLSESTRQKLTQILPDFATVSNPLDATGVAVFDMEMYGACVRSLAEDENVALVAISQDCPAGLGEEQAETYRVMANTVAELAPGLPKPVVFYSNVAGGVHPRVAEPLLAAGVPVLQGARASLLAFRRMLDTVQVPDRPAERPGLKPNPNWQDRFATGEALTEREAKVFLSEAGIPVTREKFARTADEARKAADEIGYPVVLKVESPHLPHKSDVGGVVLNLLDQRAVERAFERIRANVARNAPDAVVEGIVVQEMVPSGVEVIAGVNKEPPFGATVVVGSGGILVELVRDTALALAPIDLRRATQLISETRVNKLLEGYREHPPADKEALQELLVRLSEIAVAYGDLIQAIDLNPIIVLPEGKGLRVADALLIPAKI